VRRLPTEAPVRRLAVEQDEQGATRVDPRVAAAVVDVFVYVVVLNLFVEYVPAVITETFTLSLLTAVLLKGVLEIVFIAKNRVRAWFRAASTPAGKVPPRSCSGRCSSAASSSSWSSSIWCSPAAASTSAASCR
jgi:hypothetical protein